MAGKIPFGLGLKYTLQAQVATSLLAPKVSFKYFCPQKLPEYLCLWGSQSHFNQSVEMLSLNFFPYWKRKIPHLVKFCSSLTNSDHLGVKEPILYLPKSPCGLSKQEHRPLTPQADTHYSQSTCLAKQHLATWIRSNIHKPQPTGCFPVETLG